MQLTIFITTLFVLILFLILKFFRKKSKEEIKKYIIYLFVLLLLVFLCFISNCLNVALLIAYVFKQVPETTSNSVGFWDFFITAGSFFIDVLVAVPTFKDFRKEHVKICNHEIYFSSVKIIDCGFVDEPKTKEKISVIFIEPDTVLNSQYSIILEEIKIYLCLYPDIFKGIIEEQYEKINSKKEKEWVLKDIITDVYDDCNYYTKIKNGNLEFSLSFELELAKIQGIVSENEWFKNDTDTLIVDIKYSIVKKSMFNFNKKTVKSSAKSKTFLSVFNRNRKNGLHIFEAK